MRYPPNDRGMAVLLAVLTATLLSALGSSLLLVANVERRAVANAGYATETLSAAEAGLERALLDLRRSPDWSPLVGGAATSAFAGPRGQVTLPVGGTFDLNLRTAELQAQSWSAGAFGANTPVWCPIAWGPLSALAAQGAIDSLQYLTVWIADDPADADGAPNIDQNGIVLLHAESRGPAGSRRMIEAVVSRPPAGGVRLVTWREVR